MNANIEQRDKDLKIKQLCQKNVQSSMVFGKRQWLKRVITDVQLQVSAEEIRAKVKRNNVKIIEAKHLQIYG